MPDPPPNEAGSIPPPPKRNNDASAFGCLVVVLIIALWAASWNPKPRRGFHHPKDAIPWLVVATTVFGVRAVVHWARRR